MFIRISLKQIFFSSAAQQRLIAVPKKFLNGIIITVNQSVAAGGF